ncbi:MAG: IS3 family transposase [Butyrivibrio sp.]|nr:IS3 family transposase [Butyrivibrio sp.]
MYTLDQKQMAIDTFLKLRSHRKTIRLLGYPGSRNTLRQWIREFEDNGKLNEPQYKSRVPKFSNEQIKKAVDHWLNNGMNVAFTCRELGYPSHSVLTKWLDEHIPTRAQSALKGSTLRKYSYNDKVVASIRLTCREGTALEVAQDIGVSASSLYKWKNQLIPMGERFKMDTKLSTYEDLSTQVSDLEHQAMLLKQQVHRLQLEKDALEKATELIKKAKGIKLQTLPNCEKAIIIDALRNDYCLKELLELMNISKSSYFYQHSIQKKPEKYAVIRELITSIFSESGETYGYRRVHAVLKRRTITVSEKVIRRLMREERLTIKKVRIRKYSSYQGEISEAVPNIINRNFRASAPNEKWLTDITEFHIPAGKVYLSPIIDCFDGLPVAWTIGTAPNAELVNTMLDIAIENMPEGVHPIIHTDRGAHYRWPGWIDRMENAGLTRSMSKKGCSPDNAACEAFFGRLKNEMFYNHSWTYTSIDEFIDILDNYIRWYSTSRIKMSLGAMSPIEYRRFLGLIA